MNGPFFRNYSHQQPSRSVPVQQQKPSPKVISIPVHFVSSDQPPTTISMLKDSAAVKIQKVFRGFAVRKSVRRIGSIRNDVSEIERRIEDIEAVNSIRRDAKERLRVNEMIMRLLLKLDSIRGVDGGVRELRKAVTRKAIALQEKVDSIDQQTLDHSPDCDNSEIDVDGSVCTSNASERVTEASISAEMDDNHVDLKAVEDGGDDSVVVEEIVKEVVTDCDNVKAMETEISPAANSTEFGGKDVQKQEESSFANYDEGSREILRSLVGDNEKMMKLMSQISERNEMQTRMINSLSRRVEQLEKALRTEKLRKKKKSHGSMRRWRETESFCI